MLKLDKKTRSILYELDTNSRQSNAQIAKAVGVSKDVVNYRIKQLESNGVIQYYAAIIDTSKLGYMNIRIILSLTNLNPKGRNALINFLISYEEVFFVSVHESNSDIVVGYLTKDLSLLHEFMNLLKMDYSNLIDSIDFAFYDTLYHLHRKYLTNSTPHVEVIKGGDTPEHDELDIRILKLLAADARIAVSKLSRDLGKPVTTIISRIRNLEKRKIILGYSTILSSSKLGMEYIKIEAKLSEPDEKNGMVEYCKQHPHIIYYMKTTGNWDIEIFVEIESMAKLGEIIQEIQKKFPIKKLVYRAEMKYFKFRYF